MTELGNLLREALSGGSLVALPLALVGGVVSGLNPCCLALYPAAAGTCCALRGERAQMALSNSLGFVLGLAVATSVLGVGAAVAGLVLTGVGGWLAYAIAAVPLLMGLHLLGWIQLPMPRASAIHMRRGFFGSFAAALLVWAVIAPCGTPVLAATLSYAAHEGSPLYGAGLLFLYGLGAGLPVMLLGTLVGDVARRLDRQGWRIWVDRATGVALLGFGLYLVWIA